MYTLKKVLELANVGEDIYCEVYRSDRYIAEGWLSDLDLESDTKIERYRKYYDVEGYGNLILFLA